MKIVLDTNVLVSGLLTPYGAPGEIIRMVSSGSLQLCYDARIIYEYRNVLKRPKFRLREDHVEPLLELIEAEGYIVASTPLPERLPDRNDEPFLEAAVAAGAEFLVTGNMKHYPVEKRQGIIVLFPEEFLERYRTK